MNLLDLWSKNCKYTVPIRDDMCPILIKVRLCVAAMVVCVSPAASVLLARLPDELHVELILMS